MGINIDDSLLLVIDVQEKLLNAAFNKDLCLKKASIMTKAADILEIPVIMTEQYPKGLGATVEELKCENSVRLEKTTFSAYEIIRGIIEDKKQIFVFGIETHICVNQTVQDLIKAGHEVYIIKDACASRFEAEHLAGLERMKELGAQILTTEIALFEWLKTSKHPKFKDVQALIK